MSLQFVDLESVLKELKPGAVIKYVAKNGTIAEVMFVGYEDWRAALVQVGQSANDAQVAKDNAVAEAKAAHTNANNAFHRGIELHNRMDQTDKRNDVHDVKVAQQVNDLQDRIFRYRFFQDGQNYFLSNRMKWWHRLDFWLAVAGLLAGLTGIVIGVT